MNQSVPHQASKFSQSENIQAGTAHLQNAAPRATAWEVFVVRHTHPGNLFFHFVSMLMFYGSPVALLVTHQWLWALPFFLSGLVGTLGHFVFKDGGVSVRESTSSPTVVFFVLIMFFKIAKGTYSADVVAARAKLQNMGA